MIYFYKKNFTGLEGYGMASFEGCHPIASSALWFSRQASIPIQDGTAPHATCIPCAALT